ncbi:MAG: hypothetical protein ACI8X3_002470, partial [Saprospiraceae bacterium]
MSGDLVKTEVEDAHPSLIHSSLLIINSSPPLRTGIFPAIKCIDI